MENSEEKKEIKVSEVLAMLKSGKTRKEIKEFYSLTGKEMSILFHNPSLKHKKTIKPSRLSVVDDLTESKEVGEIDENPRIESWSKGVPNSGDKTIPGEEADSEWTEEAYHKHLEAKKIAEVRC